MESGTPIPSGLPEDFLESTDISALPYVNTLYFNTELAPDVVCQYIREAFSLAPELPMLGFFAYINEEEEVSDMILGEIADDVFVIYRRNETNVEMPMEVYFAYDASQSGADIEEVGFSGWNPEFDGSITVDNYNVYSLMMFVYFEALAGGTGSIEDSILLPLIAQQMQIVSPLASVAPFNREPIILEGEYQTKRLLVTTNDLIDCQAILLNERAFVSSVKIDVPAPISDLQTKIDATQSIKYLFADWPSDDSDTLNNMLTTLDLYSASN